MSEYEFDLELRNTDDIVDTLYLRYPHMHLDSPLDLSDSNQYIYGMNSYEMKFAYFTYSMGLVVFREPRIDNCIHIPDFYLFNPITLSGTLVELTLYNRDFTNCNTGNRHRNEVKKSIKRKQGQISELQGCGIPYIILYREELEQIRNNFINDFF